MKSEVNKPVTTPETNKYPALYESENGDVILVIKDGATTLVGTVVKSEYYIIGHHDTDWLSKSKWKRMESGTTVTLTQQ
jgi:hypothetical protein